MDIITITSSTPELVWTNIQMESLQQTDKNG